MSSGVYSLSRARRNDQQIEWVLQGVYSICTTPWNDKQTQLSPGVYSLYTCLQNDQQSDRMSPGVYYLCTSLQKDQQTILWSGRHISAYSISSNRSQGLTANTIELMVLVHFSWRITARRRLWYLIMASDVQKREKKLHSKIKMRSRWTEWL